MRCARVWTAVALAMTMTAASARAEELQTGALGFGSGGYFICLLTNVGTSDLDLNSGPTIYDVDGDDVTYQNTPPSFTCGATLGAGQSCIAEAPSANFPTPTGLIGVGRCGVDIDGPAADARLVLELRQSDGAFLISEGRPGWPASPIPASIGIATGIVATGLLLRSGMKRAGTRG